MKSPPRVALIGVSSLWLAAGIQTSAGCDDGSSDEHRALHVFAASSLTDAFVDMERSFEAVHPDADVTVTFSGSQVLRLQIEHGAAADVFASANLSHMQALVDAGWVRDSRVFAHNELVVIVPRDNPAAIQAFDDLPKATRLVIGTAHVPVGAYTREALSRAGGRLGGEFAAEVRRRVVSEENNVRLVRAKVEVGEADAAIVYRTDAASSERVRLIPIPEDLNVRADYAIGVVADGPNRGLAHQWLAFVTSRQGQTILSRHGFSTGR